MSGVPPLVFRIPLGTHLGDHPDAHPDVDDEPISISRRVEPRNPHDTAISASPSSPCFPPPLPPPPEGGHHRFQLEFPISRDIQKPSSGSGERYKPSSSSSSSASQSKTILGLTSPKASTLDSSAYPEDAIDSDAVETRQKWAPVPNSPGDITSRYYIPPSDEHLSKACKTSSVHFFADESSTYNSHRKSPVRLLLTPRKKAPDEHIHPIGESSSSSSSSGSDAPLISFCFEEAAPELHLMTDKKKKFSAEAAAKEIVSCLKRPGGKELVLELFSLYHHIEKEGRIDQRWNLLLTSTLLYPQCVDLIYAFLKKEGILAHNFAPIIVAGFLQKKTPPIQIAHILSLYTHDDLKGEDPLTLFRGETLSSYLHSGYGNHLLEDSLNNLKKEIFRYWKKAAPPTALCLDAHKVRQTLSKSHKGFDRLSEGEKNELCVQTVKHNKNCCREFFRFFLNKLYESPLPQAFQDLLSIRRKQIYDYLISKEPIPLEEAPAHSEVFIGEVLFLRIINPYLRNIGKKSSEIDALTNLMKMIQSLSNQVRFGSEKKDEVFESFNDIYDIFIQKHRDYINHKFPLRFSPRIDLA